MKIPSLAELRRQLLEKQKKEKEESKEKRNIIATKKTFIPKTPKGYVTIKIPENIDDLKIAKLRSIYSDLFGKEPKHDALHDKEWIAYQIKKILSKGD